MDISEYKELFIAESKELVAALNRVILQLEKSPNNLSLVEDIFRSMHTLKGMSATMGYQKIVRITHQLEELLDSIKQREKMPSEEVIDVLFSSIDLLHKLIELSGKREIEEVEIEPILNRIESISYTIADMRSLKRPAKRRAKEEEVSEEIKEAENEWNKYLKEKQKDYKLVRITIKLTESCQLKGSRAYVIITTAQKLGRIIKSLPDVDSLKSGDFGLSFQIFLSTKQIDEIKASMASISEVEWSKIETIGFQEIYPEFLPPDKKAAKPTISQDLEKPELGLSRYLPAESESIRINMRRLNNLMNITGELFILQRRMENLGQHYKLDDLNELLDHSSRLVGSLQDSVMSARMVPVWQVFNLFPRFIRDAAKKMGKKAQYIIEGGDIEIDRVVLDKISEPLMHLIRNSIDHGLESPGKRRKAGKSEEGLIKVSISRQGYSFLILVEDDGKGIDIEEVKRISLEKGLVSQEELESMSPEETLYLITKPGYSTSLKATDVSGRGVGLSIVHQSVRSLGGSFKANSEKGKGTQFTIILPATMAIVKVLLMGVGDEIYAMPISYVSEIIDCAVAELKALDEKEVIIYRKESYQLLRLRHIFSLPQQDSISSSEEFILLIEIDERKFALAIDSFYKQQEVVVKPFAQVKTNLYCFSGATILGSGQVALIIDPRGLI